ncbi:MAG: DUF4160 domain-containing protein [Lachnospiraceae bacterium]|nr:DUF4160 domain-containing protein [Lachnospiraceae bacterium]
MPVISRFKGVILRMYLRQKEHNPPHIHAQYGETVGLFSIENGEMFEGDLDKKMRSFVTNFILYYREQLIQMWETQKFSTLDPIE